MQPRILLVDDREDNLLSMETVLEPNGYQFYKASSGREALKILLDETDFAIILMDVKMPVLNGFETATLIYEREKLKHIPIIFITANNYGDENVFRGYEAGGIDYIFKPINPEVLRVKVSVFVNLYKKNRLLQDQEQKLLTANERLANEINERKVAEAKVIELNTKLQEKIDHLQTTNAKLTRITVDSAHEMHEMSKALMIACDKLLAGNRDGSSLDSKTITQMRQSSERIHETTVEMLAFSEIATA